MKRMVLIASMLLLATSLVFAGGDKVRGDKGQGDVNQVQVEDPPPFQDDGLTAFFLWLFE